MSEQETHRWNPRFRRRRKWQGATWTPTNQSAVAGDGVWCKACKTRHGFVNGLNIGFDKDSKGRWQILWSCKRTGDVVQIDILNNGPVVS